MKAMILRGKDKGTLVGISQWCNDWFSTTESPKIYSPSALAFTAEDFDTIKTHKNNGILFGIYEPKVAPPWTGKYIFTFKKRR